MGSSAHIRAGSLLEEEANGAHAVGFKQTILFPYVTAGSLINFCDCLMAGGTSRKNHSEIGSSYIHFNFTPHQDKATVSLIGDVPHGVLLNRNPIFLGGQGGLVGPVRIAFGTVIAAGVIHRRDVLADNQLITAAKESILEPRRYIQGAYRSIHRIVVNNLVYIGNIWALRDWYRHVRRLLMPGDFFTEACRQGALVQLDCILEERILRLKELADKMAASLEIAREGCAGDLPEEPYAQQKALMEGWPEMEQLLKQGPAPRDGAMLRDNFLERLSKTEMGDAYAHTIRRLDEAARNAASSWLQSIVDSAVSLWTRI
jgi:UDP-N-acetylglucosamine/UDP-N-acetylgalactosamine diphosphorylase